MTLKSEDQTGGAIHEAMVDAEEGIWAIHI